MELRILGPFQVFDDSGREVGLPTGRERALLAALVLRRGEVVSVDALVEALWGDTAPSTAVKAVQGYVSHLRRVLGSDGVLVTQAPGYVLRVPAEAVDAHRFATLAAEAWRTLQDDPESALRTFEQALALWRGAALAEFAFVDFAQREIRRLEELRLETVEGRFESTLQLGRHGAIVAELETRVAEHPLRERFWEHFRSLRDQGRTVGRLDSRYTGIDRDSAGEEFEFDPAMVEIYGAYAAAANDYYRNDLKFDADLPYEVIKPLYLDWGWKDYANRYAAVGETLRKAMSMNPHMRVLVASGYFDFATPHFAADYSLDHLGLAPELRDNIAVTYYEAGHMMYAHRPSLEKLAAELRRFVTA